MYYTVKHSHWQMFLEDAVFCAAFLIALPLWGLCIIGELVAGKDAQ